ncbi:MAG: glycoside hydrolase domain-containing protein [Acidobacteriaceae bacterium]
MLCFCTLASLSLSNGWGQAPKPYFGFDRNDYPGDALLPALRRSFSYTGYWLNNPPQEKSNSWVGKRETLKASGFGFLILYNGRLDAQLKGKDAAALGRADAATAIAAAKREGFPSGAILFLDQEEGGRLLPEQSAYLFSWVKAVRQSQYRPGVYCSAILVPDGSDQISTARDILSHDLSNDSQVALWVANEQCPPAPGCVIPNHSLSTASSGISQAVVWQYAKSPRTQYAAQCSGTYATDNECYPPGMTHSPATFVDLNVSASADPSHGR